jgi:hypothetical protein
MDPIQFLNECGVVLESGRGPPPNLAEAVAGEPIPGNWWGHKKGREIFRARAARDSNEVLVCRLVDGKITYVHCRLWPAIVRLAQFLDANGISALREEHFGGTPSSHSPLFHFGFPAMSARRPKTSPKRTPDFN